MFQPSHALDMRSGGVILVVPSRAGPDRWSYRLKAAPGSLEQLDADHWQVNSWVRREDVPGRSMLSQASIVRGNHGLLFTDNSLGHPCDTNVNLERVTGIIATVMMSEKIPTG